MVESSARLLISCRRDPPTTGTKALASAVSDSNCDDPKRLAAADTHDKVLDKIIIKSDGQAVNEHLHSTSNEPLRSASTSKEAVRWPSVATWHRY